MMKWIKLNEIIIGDLSDNSVVLTMMGNNRMFAYNISQGIKGLCEVQKHHPEALCAVLDKPQSTPSNGEGKEDAEKITIEIIDEEKQIASFKVDGKETCKFAYFTEEQFEALQPKSPIQSPSVSPVEEISKDQVIKDLFGVRLDAPDRTPMDKGECKKAMSQYAASLLTQRDDTIRELKEEIKKLKDEIIFRNEHQ